MIVAGTGGFSFGTTGGGTPGFSFGAATTPQTATSTPAAPAAGFTFTSQAAPTQPASGGFSFATPATGTATPGFSFGTPVTPAGSTATPAAAPASATANTAAPGFSFNNASAAASAPSAGLSLGLGGTRPASAVVQPLPASTGFSFTTTTQQAKPAAGQATTGGLAALVGGTARPAAAGLGGGLSAGLGGTTGGLAGTTLGLGGTALGATTAATTSTAASGLGLGGVGTTQASSAGSMGFTLGGAAKTTTTTAATSSAPPLGAGLKLGGGFNVATSSTSSASSSTLTGKPLTQPGAASASTSSVAATLSSQTTTTPSTAQAPSMNYKQLEEEINKWSIQLDEQEKIFIQQATQVNAWDRLLIENGDKISELNTEVERVKLDQSRLDGELDFIEAQQRELGDMLAPLESAVEQMPPISMQQHADLEREHTYKLSENIDAQLKRMVQDLKEIIDHMNSSNTQHDSTDPVQQIAKILNAHMHSLQWIDSNTALLQRRVDDVTRLAEHRKKEQERNFRLAYE